MGFWTGITWLTLLEQAGLGSVVVTPVDLIVFPDKVWLSLDSNSRAMLMAL
ncbi:hypothetical protein Hanom_Chr17g01591541 [Helianthus anomalus]